MTDNSSTAALRHDAEGQPIYPEWDENWDKDAAEPDDPEEQVVRTPPADILESAEHWEEFRRRVLSDDFKRDAVMEGVQKIFSTSQAAAFFGRSAQWIYWGLREGIFTYRDGTPILPERVGKNDRRRFTLPLIREMALSHYRRGNLAEEELEAIMKRILLAEFGPEAFSDTE